MAFTEKLQSTFNEMNTGIIFRVSTPTAMACSYKAFHARTKRKEKEKKALSETEMSLICFLYQA